MAKRWTVLAAVGMLGCGSAATVSSPALLPDAAALSFDGTTAYDGTKTYDGTAADSAAADAAADTLDSTAAPGADATATSLPDGEAGDGGAAPDASQDVATSADAQAAGPDAAGVVSTEVWDLALLGDVGQAKCQFEAPHDVLVGLQTVTAWKVRYVSYESVDGQLQPIEIRGYFARPKGSAALPGVVVAHGLGGHAEEKHATSHAARLGTLVLAYSGPGGGTTADNTSQGLPASAKDGYRMFDVGKDVRGSWFWAHATAAMRAVTCLQSRPDLQPGKLGITGFSAGAVVSLLVAGHDPRVVAAVPLSGTLAWSKAVEAKDAWQHTLLQKAKLTVASPEWQKLQTELIDPGPALAGAKAAVWMVNGTSDEFFPLTAHMQTFQALPGPGHRSTLAGNFDHGCYQLTGGESAKTIEDRATLRAEGAQRAWFGHWFGSDPTYAKIPALPQVQTQPVGGGTLIAATIDTAGGPLQVEKAFAWASSDDCFLFGHVEMDCKGNLCSKLVPLPMQANTVVYADVQYKTKDLLPQRFSVSSLPALPAGLVPHVRKIDTCQ